MQNGIILCTFLIISGTFSLAHFHPIHLQKFLIQTKNPKNLTQNTEYELFLDSSLQKFLDEKYPFINKKYIPTDLATIDSDFTFSDSKKFFLRKEAGNQFADMAWHFWNENKGKKLSINSAYRNYEFQVFLGKACSSKKCAKAGTSEHQAGLAVDLGINGRKIDEKSLLRLQNNAHKRGFHQSYQKGIAIDGKSIENWHWRYMGTGLATELWEKKMSFTEWFYKKKSE